MMKINYKDKYFNIKINQFLFYFIFIILIDIKYFLNHSSLPDVLYLPQGIFSLFSSPLVLTSSVVVCLKYIWLISGIFSAFNIYYKLSAFIFFIITYFSFNIAHNYGYQTHTYMPIVLASCVMAFGRQNRTFLVRFILCSIFFMAGLSKLRNGGLDWIFTESLQNMLLRSHIYYHDIHFFAHQFRLNIEIAKSLFLTQVIAFSVVVLELGAPLALLQQRFSRWIILSLLAMQIGIYFTIFVNFKVYALLYIFWIDWEWLYNKALSFIRYKNFKL